MKKLWHKALIGLANAFLTSAFALARAAKINVRYLNRDELQFSHSHCGRQFIVTLIQHNNEKGFTKELAHRWKGGIN